MSDGREWYASLWSPPRRALVVECLQRLAEALTAEDGGAKVINEASILLLAC
jgi:hypothetical protein